MRLLGLDIGDRRIGVAVSDPQARVASPLAVLDASVVGKPEPLLELAAEYDISEAIVGLPLSLDGSEGQQAKRVRETGTRIGEILGVPVRFVDERLSSAEASKAMRAAGVSSRDQRGRLDMVAAAVFLQAYLDSATARVARSRIPSSDEEERT